MVAVSSFLPLAVTCLATVAAAVPAGLTGSKASPSFPTLAELNAKLVLSTKWYENNHTDWKAGNSSLTKRTADPIVNPTCLHDNNYGVAAITWSYYAHNFCMNWGAHSAFGASGRQIYVGYVDLRDILQQGLVVNFGLTFVPMATVTLGFERCATAFDQMISTAVYDVTCSAFSNHVTGDHMGIWGGGATTANIGGNDIDYYLWITPDATTAGHAPPNSIFPLR